MGCGASSPSKMQGAHSVSPAEGGLGADEAKGSEHHVVASEHSKTADSSTQVHKLRVELSVASGFGNASMYAVLSHGTLRARTKVVGGDGTAVFNELVDFVTVHRPEEVTVEMYSFNRLRKDTLLGSSTIHIPAGLFAQDADAVPSTAKLVGSEGGQAGEVAVNVSGARVVGQQWHMRHQMSYTNTLGLLSMHAEGGVHASGGGAKALKAGKYLSLVLQLAGAEFRTSPTLGSASGNGAVAVQWGQTSRSWVQAESERHLVRLLLMGRATPGGKDTLLAAGSVQVSDLLGTRGDTIRLNLLPASQQDVSTDSLLSQWKAMQLHSAPGPASPTPAPAHPATAAGEDSPASLPQPEDGLVAKGVPVAATVDMHFSFSSKDEAERWFMAALMAAFDSDGDGQLSVEELAGMLTVLGTAFKQEGAAAGGEAVRAEASRLMATLDSSGDQQVDEEEVLALLRSAEFQTGPFGYSVLNFLADGYEARHALMNLHPIIQRSGETASGADVVTVSSSAGTGSAVDADGLMVFDDATGILVREHIPGYVKAALDLAYKGLFDSPAFVQSAAMRSVLRAMTAKEGKHMDSPASAAEIPDFVAAHHINTEEIEGGLESFSTFNEFFVRKLKASARPLASPGDDSVAVSPADCRMVAFPSLHEATSLWVKGSSFTVDSLLGPSMVDHAPKFRGGTLLIARLAPQDYHRWHFPVSGEVVVPPTPIEGDLFTVNPVAVRRTVNVYTENKRVVSMVQSPAFGSVAIVAVGATMVGSINITGGLEAGPVTKGQEHGFFAFGGSTVLLLFQPKSIWLDDGIVRRSRLPMETLVQMGRAIGVPFAHRPGAAARAGAASEGKK